MRPGGARVVARVTVAHFECARLSLHFVSRRQNGTMFQRRRRERLVASFSTLSRSDLAPTKAQWAGRQSTGLISEYRDGLSAPTGSEMDERVHSCSRLRRNPTAAARSRPDTEVASSSPADTPLTHKLHPPIAHLHLRTQMQTHTQTSAAGSPPTARPTTKTKTKTRKMSHHRAHRRRTTTTNLIVAAAANALAVYLMLCCLSSDSTDHYAALVVTANGQYTADQGEYIITTRVPINAVS